MRMHRSIPVLGVLLLASVPSCRNSDTVTGIRNVAPTPAPTAAPQDVSGSWSGTWSPRPPACPEASATLFIEQNGARLSGEVSTSNVNCGFRKSPLAGTVNGYFIDGILQGGVLRGTSVGANLRLELQGNGETVSGRFDLHR